MDKGQRIYDSFDGKKGTITDFNETYVEVTYDDGTIIHFMLETYDDHIKPISPVPHGWMKI